MSDKIDKLSTAIRVGASYRPQCFGFLAIRDGYNGIAFTCALGGAVMALNPNYGFGELILNGRETLEYRFPLVPSVLFSHIQHFNDVDRWSREKIADYVESKGY